MSDSVIDIGLEFNKLRRNIHDKIQVCQSKDELTPLRNDITQLKDWLIERNELKAIAAFDLKNYSKQIDTLVFEFDDCKKKFIQKRFKFKNKPIEHFNKTLVDSDDRITSIKVENNTEIADYLKPTYENLLNIKLTIPKSHSGTNIYLKNIRNSIIIVPDELKVNSITLEGSQNTIYLIHSQTFTFINDLKHCVINGTSQQLRIHDCIDSFIGIKIMNQLNRFIIENCKDLKIIQFKNNGSVLKVDDFNFPNQFEKNPHYKFLNENWLTDNTKANEMHDFVQITKDGTLNDLVDLSNFL